jgi:predicted DNA-binding antitoxin AbrB/MazE fold protein
MLVHARYSKGTIELLENVDLVEGEDFFIDIVRGAKSLEERLMYLRKSAGAWKGLIDAEELKRNIYADRLVRTRKEVKL